MINPIQLYSLKKSSFLIHVIATYDDVLCKKSMHLNMNRKMSFPEKSKCIC